jgi:hypothetical protein
VPARELTTQLATAAAARMIPAVAALAARAGGAEVPVPLSVRDDCGTLLYLPPGLTPEQAAALAAFHDAFGLRP